MYYLVECSQLNEVGALPILWMMKMNLNDRAIQLVSRIVRVQTQAEFDSRNLTLNHYIAASQNVPDTVDMKGKKNLDSNFLTS